MGDAGGVNINTGSLTLTNGGEVNVSTFGQGDAGQLFVNANTLSLDSNAKINATTQSGLGGLVNLQITEDITLKNNSTISAEAFNDADGGNLTIDARFIIAFPDGNNDILASSQQGNGGNITINAESLLGIQERPLNDSTNDINASSEVTGLDGTINITTSDINPVQGATELPSNVVDSQQITQQACEANRELAAKSSFTIKGKGGVPPAPELPLSSQNISINGEFNPTSAIPQPIQTSQGEIQPARGIKVTESGGIILTAYRTNNAGERIPEGSRNCG